jgi:hypothetical protein
MSCTKLVAMELKILLNDVWTLVKSSLQQAQRLSVGGLKWRK